MSHNWIFFSHARRFPRPQEMSLEQGHLSLWRSWIHFWNLNKKKIIYSFVMMHFLWYMRQSFGMQQIFYKWYIFLKNSSSSYEYVNFGSAKNANCYPKPSNQCQIHGQIFTCNDRKTWKFQWHHHHHHEVSFSFQNSLSIT